MEQDNDSNILPDSHVRDYRKRLAEKRKRDYFYKETTPLSRLIKMAKRLK